MKEGDFVGKNEKRAFVATLLCLVFMVAGWFADRASFNWAPILFVIAIISGGYKQTSEGLTELMEKKTVNVDLLMALAAIGACLTGNWFEGAMLTFIFCLSGFLEEYTTNKSRKEITALMNLQPTLAQRYKKDGQLETVAVEELAIEDVLLVPKGDTIPIDSIIVEGASPINEAVINGESMPTDKAEGDEVFGGTLNLGNPLVVKVTRASQDTVMAKILRLVEEAENTPTKTASFLARIENTYVKVVLVTVPLLILLSHFLLHWTWEESFYRGMVMLVVASPCALVASATPATLAAISSSARNGILLKGGVALEHLAHLQAVSFDKTGTLTKGEPIVTEAVFLDSDPIAKELLVAMESLSTHPLAKAVVDHFPEISLTEQEKNLAVEDVTGFGLQCSYQGQTWRIGKPSFTKDTFVFPESETVNLNRLHERGNTIIYLTRDGQLVGYLALQDVAKPEAFQVVKYFKEQEIYTCMLTGDNEKTAKVIAHNLGLDDYRAGLLPQDKAQIVAQFHDQYGVNAMVGDGINDAPALANATIGVAMGDGTDLAVEVADLVLMKNDLNKLQMVHQQSKRMERIIKQNIAFSIAVICLLLLSNFVQVLSLPLGVIGHEGSTILVILNGLRMLKMNTISQENSDCADCPLQAKPTETI